MGKVLLEEQSLIDIANSIRNKTGSNETMKPSEMATNIDGIESGGTDLSEYFTGNIAGGNYAIPYTFKKIPPLTNIGTSCSSMFANCINVTDIDLSKFDTSNVTTMKSMFNSCLKLASIDVSNFDISKTNDMSEMFYGCEKLIDLDLSIFGINEVTTTYRMFYNCKSLVSLKLPNFDTSKVTNMNQMFYYCINLTHLDIRNFDFTNVTSFSNMFGSSNSNRVPSNCLVIVKDETAKEWILARRSDFTNVKTVAEYESGV